MTNKYSDRVYVARIEAALSTVLSCEKTPPQLLDAMRYVVLSGGKRLRAQLVYTTGLLFTNDLARLDAAACAVELIHAYSLVHDDLPAMDDDDLRRGKPTCHKAYDEATAILVGDALQALAFSVLANSSAPVTPTQQIKMIQQISAAAGAQGMVGGQYLDLQATTKVLDEAAITHIHRCKTGALFHASIMLGALAGGCEDDAVFVKLDKYAQQLGFAFQVQDDILDIEGSTEQLGKTQGKDVATQKATFPAATSLAYAKEKVSTSFAEALASLTSLASITEISELLQLTQYISQRKF